MRKKFVALAVAGQLALHGCATPGGGSGSASGDVEQACNPVILGALAFAGCALISNGKKRVATGAACAAVAVLGCYMVNSYKAQQTRTAQQVEDDYLKRNKQLPERATLTSYSTKINPQGAVQRGAKVEVASTIVVVPGKKDKNVKVEEKLAIVDARGDQWGEPVTKAANESGQGGEFRSSFKIPVHDGMSQGVYTLRKTVFINGTAARDDNSAKFQVVEGPNGLTVAVVAE